MSGAFRFIMMLVVLLGVSLALLAPWRYRVLETRELMAGFRHEVDARSVDLGREISLNLEVLFAFQGLMIGSQKVEETEFVAVAADARVRHGEILALAWIPFVPDKERERFEHSQRKSDPAFRLHDVNAEGRSIAAGPRAGYYPFLFLEPEKTLGRLKGMDLGADPACLRMLRNARDRGVVQLAGDFKLSGLTDKRRTLLGLLPVYAGTPSDIASRRAQLLGFVAGIYDFAALFERAGWRDFSTLSMVRLMDGPDGVQGRELFAYRRSGGKAPGGDVYERDLTIAGNSRWRLEVVPVDDYISRHRSMIPWFFVGGGILVALTVPLYVWLMARHAASVEALVWRRTRELDEANRKLASLSLTDGLTGIANRRYFDDHLAGEWKRAQREQQPLSLIMVDIDHFKAYNDYYGHLAGDDCLRQVARMLSTVVARPGDMVARYGGEEFALILPQTHNGAKVLAERCRATVAGTKIPHHASPIKPVVTVSVGAATMIPDGDSDPSDLIEKADQALYRAKLLGRNHVVVEALAPKSDAAVGRGA